MKAECFCIHSDTPTAVPLAKAVREALTPWLAPHDPAERAEHTVRTHGAGDGDGTGAAGREPRDRRGVGRPSRRRSTRCGRSRRLLLDDGQAAVRQPGDLRLFRIAGAGCRLVPPDFRVATRWSMVLGLMEAGVARQMERMRPAPSRAPARSPSTSAGSPRRSPGSKPRRSGLRRIRAHRPAGGRRGARIHRLPLPAFGGRRRPGWRTGSKPSPIARAWRRPARGSAMPSNHRSSPMGPSGREGPDVISRRLRRLRRPPRPASRRLRPRCGRRSGGRPACRRHRTRRRPRRRAGP